MRLRTSVHTACQVVLRVEDLEQRCLLAADILAVESVPS